MNNWEKKFDEFDKKFEINNKERDEYQKKRKNYLKKYKVIWTNQINNLNKRLNKYNLFFLELTNPNENDDITYILKYSSSKIFNDKEYFFPEPYAYISIMVVRKGDEPAAWFSWHTEDIDGEFEDCYDSDTNPKELDLVIEDFIENQLRNYVY